MPGGHLVHEALLYRRAEDYLATTLAFISDAIAAGERVLVAVPEPNLGLLRRNRPAADDRVVFVDMAVAGRNPNRILPGVLQAFADAHQPDRVRIVGESVFAGRGSQELPWCVRHEAMINIVFDGRPVDVLCPYHTGLATGVLYYAERTHPVVFDGERRRPGKGYGDPAAVVALLNQPLPEPPRVDELIVFEAYQLGFVRRVVAEHARCAGLPAQRVADLAAAVDEVARDTIRHASFGPGTLRVWSDTEAVVCEIRGKIDTFDLLLAGRSLASPQSPRGRALWLADSLCDLVQTHNSPAGTVTRLHVRR